jgi:hypothetical protein
VDIRRIGVFVLESYSPAYVFVVPDLALIISSRDLRSQTKKN